MTSPLVFDDSVTVLGKAEEVAFFLQQFHVTAAVGAFAILQLCFCEEGFAGSAVPAFVGGFVDIALIVKLFEDFLYCFYVVIVYGTDESVIGNSHQLPQIFNACNDFICVFLGGHALTVGDTFDLLTVFVCTCQEHNVIAPQSFVTSHCVCCYCAVGMTNVQLITGIVNGCGDVEFFFSQKYLSVLNKMVCYVVGSGDGDNKKPPFLNERTDISAVLPTLLCFSLAEKTSVGRYPKG